MDNSEIFMLVHNDVTLLNPIHSEEDNCKHGVYSCLRMHWWSWPTSFKNVETAGIKDMRKKRTPADMVSNLRTKISCAPLKSAILSAFEALGDLGGAKLLMLQWEMLLMKGGCLFESCSFAINCLYSRVLSFALHFQSQLMCLIFIF